MPRRFAVPVLLALTLVVGIVTGASAQSISDCQALIETLRDNTQSVEFIGKNAEKDRVGLVRKLDEAALKLDAEKLSDAIEKLNDFDTRVQQLAGAGKLAFADAEGLHSGAIAAIDCIGDAATAAAIASSS